MQIAECVECEKVIEAICRLNWENLTQDDITDVATGYYYFSIQFGENLRVARELFPGDDKLRQLEEAECNTDNLSPWPGVAHPREKMNHDEFMRRLLTLSPVDQGRRDRLDATGQTYLWKIRGMQREARAGSIASYEDGGLERVFWAMLRCRQWGSPLLQAFKHFLVEHIRFDSDAEHGHGGLSRHLPQNDRQVLPCWLEFKRMLVESAPALLA